jgi:hypothetical protein
VAYVVGGAEEGVGGGAGAFEFAGLTDEEEDLGALAAVVDVALAGVGGFARRRLRLPVEEVRRDGVVAVAGGWGVVLFALLEGDEEAVGFYPRIREDAALERTGFSRVELPIAAIASSSE